MGSLFHLLTSGSNSGGAGSLFPTEHLLGPINEALPKIHDVIENLNHCDVKVNGMCCYLPSYCHPHAKCISEPNPGNVFEIAQTFPRCVCPEGFQGDGKTRGVGCTNIDECALGLAQCEHLCVDLIPGYQCECHQGYRLRPDGRTCEDIDECQNQGAECDHFCHNTPGSYECSCAPGYRLTSRFHCEDIDECAEANESGFSICQYQEYCLNTLGSYECGCPPGLKPMEGDDRQCQDIDECLSSPSACPNSVVDGTWASQLCENVYGTHFCSCLPGTRPRYTDQTSSELPKDVESLFELVDETQRERLILSADDIRARYLVGERQSTELFCEDINECVENPGICGQAKCINTFRNYQCECDINGFSYNDETGECEDIDECTEGDPCGALEDSRVECRNESPGFTCLCPAGFEYLDAGRCIDIDECLNAAESCPSNSICVNNLGSYTCECAPGFHGPLCLDLDECANEFCTGPCLNHIGKFSCACEKGTAAWGFSKPQGKALHATVALAARAVDIMDTKSFQQFAASNQIRCDDMDECSLTQGRICPKNSECANSPKGFLCRCEQGYYLQYQPLQSHPALLQKITTGIATLINSFDIAVLIAAIKSTGICAFTKAFESLESEAKPLWHLTQIDWDLSPRLICGDDPVPLTALHSKAHVLLHISELLHGSQIGVCSPSYNTTQNSRVCQRLNPNPCPRVATPCCRDLPNGGHECLMPISRGFRILSAPRCPPGTISKLNVR